MIEQFSVSRDDSIYQAFPDVALTPSGRLVCVFAECMHHADRSYTCIMVTTSDDRGRTWTPKRRLTKPLKPGQDRWWNCPRITLLADGRLVAVVDCIAGADEGHRGGEQSNWLYFSKDEGERWDGPHATPLRGIVPNKLVELKVGAHAGRWILSAHTELGTPQFPLWAERCWVSDDRGKHWAGPHTIACEPGLKLCEGSVMELPGGELMCVLRENSGEGWDAFKCLSSDGGTTWEGPYRMPIPACHRPVAGMLRSGRVMITHRFMQGGKGWTGWWRQNLFAALTDVESCLARGRRGAHTRIMPISFDRSPESDTGYSGWVQFTDGEIYVVNYLLDDAPKGQIRGYAFRESDFLIEPAGGKTKCRKKTRKH